MGLIQPSIIEIGSRGRFGVAMSVPVLLASPIINGVVLKVIAVAGSTNTVYLRNEYNLVWVVAGIIIGSGTCIKSALVAGQHQGYCESVVDGSTSASSMVDFVVGGPIVAIESDGFYEVMRGAPPIVYQPQNPLL